MSTSSTLLIAGDCGPAHGPADGFPIEGYTANVQPALEQADFRFVNCMRTYSSRAVVTEHARQVNQDIGMSAIFTSGLFDAVTLANNHSYDSGPDALVDTRELMLSKGVQVTGAGANLDEARQTAIIERNGVRVGYLGYTSVGKPGSEAGPDKPGIAVVRVHTTYEQRGPHETVGVRTTADAADLERLVEDITALRKQVDVVVLAYHAGVIRLPRIISDYQVEVAHAAIDAGADLVVGHAPHIPKAIEMYKGKPIFYSIGVFAMTKPFAAPSWNEPAWRHGAVRNHADLDPAFPFMPYGEACTLSLMVKVDVTPEGVQRVAFLPMSFDTSYRPEILRHDDPRFDVIVNYLEWVSEDMPHRFTVDGDEVVVSD
ncbi:CapA family protein [Pigmentiphaga litoralis]|uniref:Poly-gamma-glutamate synthesis protein (Capsule biosynthesis protein) n=1 Tax=Pigmentiphaga litoralis TaxID=516702 RepID=A0A7Y9LNJ4_9BURK|nr:poly-gamma-glutamate synthesis protein (capsule biosynthesis protein) [Pigmentiphaga litoralis]NYE83233.1 poly-gamma-glutamate synthesis protein (capsule biosynthesis protein) [Pigmentiphaga litoralis]